MLWVLKRIRKLLQFYAQEFHLSGPMYFGQVRMAIITSQLTIFGNILKNSLLINFGIFFLFRKHQVLLIDKMYAKNRLC